MNDQKNLEEINRLEESLKQAMLSSNIELLDKLISPSLIFTNHLGQRITKQQDLDDHRSQRLKIDVLELSEQEISMHGETAIVSVKTRLEGKYNQQPAEGEFRFTRVWSRSKTMPYSSHTGASRWQIVAGHSCLMV